MPDYQMAGSLGRNPELNYTPNGTAVAKFSLAVNVGTKDKPRKLWVKCVAWKDMAERVEKHLFQGNLIGVNGKVSDVETWMDKDGKTPKAALVFTCFEIGRYEKGVGFVDIRGLSLQEQPESSPASDEDIPF